MANKEDYAHSGSHASISEPQIVYSAVAKKEAYHNQDWAVEE